jgi:hypothetical protein
VIISVATDLMEKYAADQITDSVFVALVIVMRSGREEIVVVESQKRAVWIQELRRNVTVEENVFVVRVFVSQQMRSSTQVCIARIV